MDLSDHQYLQLKFTMGIKNSKQSVNISTIPKKDAKVLILLIQIYLCSHHRQKSEVTENGDITEKSDADNLKVLKVATVIDPSLNTSALSGIGGGSSWRES